MLPRFDGLDFDHRMMHWLVRFSSSDAGRRAAEAWLAAFAAARATGADEAEAYTRAGLATRDRLSHQEHADMH